MEKELEQNGVESLKPNKTSRFSYLWERPRRPSNPLKVLGSLNRIQAITFTAAFLGWTLDAFDFLLVSFTLKDIAEDLNVSETVAATAITLTLVLRPLGAAIFGLLADRFGRRWPLMIDVLLFSLIGLLTGFVQNLTQFLVLRALFGICMGGEWGLGASLAMESLPPDARGIFSGILQQGHAFGYLLAALLFYAVYPTLGWRAMFYIGSFPAVLCIFIRFFVPESEAWKQENERKKEAGVSSAKSWLKDTGNVFKRHWKRFIYMVVLLSGLNFISHGFQDLFPTFLRSQLGYTPSMVTVTTVSQNLAGIVGGTVVGWYSEYFGRRRSMACACLLGLCVVPIWGFAGVDSYGLQIFGSTLMEFCIQGAWGVVPALLTENSPPEVRGTFPGLTYQLGNMLSAAAAQIVAALGNEFPLPDGRPNYALVLSVMTWCTLGLTFVIILFGFEQTGKSFVAEEVDPSIELSMDNVTHIKSKSYD